MVAFHAYYAGETGVWMHNSCSAADVAGLAARAKAIEDACFSASTPILIRLNEDTDRLIGRRVRPDSSGNRIGVLLWCEIDHLVPGVEVLARCEHTGEAGYRKITKLFKHAPKDVFDLTFDLDIQAGGRRLSEITVTGNHPIWVIGKGWTPVRALEVNDELVTYNGTKAQVVSLSHRPSYGSPVYNLEVEDLHTYFVDHFGIWVHSKNQ